MSYVLQLASLATGTSYQIAEPTERDRQRDALFKCLSSCETFPKFPYSVADQALDVALEACGMEKRPTDTMNFQGYSVRKIYQSTDGGSTTNTTTSINFPFNWHRDFLPVLGKIDSNTGQMLYVPLLLEKNGRRFLLKRLPWLKSWPLTTPAVSRRLLEAFYEMCGYNRRLTSTEKALLDFQCERINEIRQCHPLLYETPEKLNQLIEDKDFDLEVEYAAQASDRGYDDDDDDDDSNGSDTSPSNSKPSTPHIPQEVLRACLSRGERTPKRRASKESDKSPQSDKPWTQLIVD